MAATPLAYTANNGQSVLGHYGVAQVSGAIAATPTALDPHASIRWSDTMAAGGRYFVLERLRVGWAVISAVTTAVRMAYQASIARQFTVDYVTGSTPINMSTAGGNKMRSTMSPSQMGTTGPRITTTGAMSGHTNTLDNAPFAINEWTSLVSVTATGVAVAQQAGMAGEMKTLYDWTAAGQHPVVLGPNEGIVVQLTHTGWASGTVALYTEWTWAEVLSFPAF